MLPRLRYVRYRLKPRQFPLLIVEGAEESLTRFAPDQIELHELLLKFPFTIREMLYFPSRFISRDILLRFVSCHSLTLAGARAADIYARYTLYCAGNGLANL